LRFKGKKLRVLFHSSHGVSLASTEEHGEKFEIDGGTKFPTEQKRALQDPLQTGCCVPNRRNGLLERLEFIAAPIGEVEQSFVNAVNAPKLVQAILVGQVCGDEGVKRRIRF